MNYNYDYDSPNNEIQGNVIPIGGYGDYSDDNIPTSDIPGYHQEEYNEFDVMGNYYNDMYSSMYDPYEMAKQERIRQEQFMKEEKRNNDILKVIFKTAYEYCNNGAESDFIDEYFEPKEEKREDFEIERNQKLLSIIHDPNTLNYNPEISDRIDRWNRIYEESKTFFPQKAEDFIENSGYIMFQMQEEERRIADRNLTPLYNSDEYNQLLSDRGEITYLSNRYDNNKEISIDDIEIGLGTRATEKLRAIKRQRQKFIDSIKLNN